MNTPTKRIVIVSDVAVEQSGVVTSLTNTQRVLTKWGHDVLYLTPSTLKLFTIPLIGIDRFFKVGIPFLQASMIGNIIEEFNPDCIHISTEAFLGYTVWQLCKKKGWKFSTAFHTMSAEFLEKSMGLPAWISWRTLTQFHDPSSSVMVPTMSVENILRAKGVEDIQRWSRGVDTDRFYPRERDPIKYPKQNGPILMFVGRVSVEKGIEEFLKLPIQKGTKYVVGEGPQCSQLEKMFPDAVFLGYLKGDDLASAYSNADVVVFTSKTDTFGNTITESLACGTPVAAFPTPGPIDIIGCNRKVGSINENLVVAIFEALSYGNSEACVKHV
ncbi:GDP-mannose-dependent alpha-mannosyltransferase [Seminavis robusta]|uniref:GDP-mannose-dependent alpha-mannosyltransferase n=1 Tax=Seminavis robusta TaxID=568900 RepID=A0A9N8EDC5_9STRA|nr:GDP-mannose-dependent alpha-mannosyltransferase [Seminavis robusta]|eukprot:Sro912_g219280.1 GDP-mannose-dependent alpha-mannosyltransferase (328) ;mRNA; f:4132-5115